MALATSTIMTALTAWQLGYIGSAPLYWLLIPSGLIAILGVCDDLFNLDIGIRLVVQFFLAGLGIYFIGINNNQPLVIQGLMIVGEVLFLVWMTNLYNFMDGINGLATLEAISACIGIILIYWIKSIDADALYLMIIITASSCGFLYWNFPTAKLFMGDAGSLFLGLSLGLLTLEIFSKDAELVVAWLIMLGVFIVDASYTLCYRLITKQAFHQAHRTHTYQKVAVKFKSHAHTTLAVLAINLFWLLPLAVAAATAKLPSIAALLIAYGPLILLAKMYHAGRPE